MNYIQISGNHYQVGYRLGKWWGEYFLANRQTPAMKRLLKKYDYFDYLQNSWSISKNGHAPLLEHTMQCFPEIIQEIAGIEKGVSDAFSDSSVKTIPSFLDIFCLCLGETDDPKYNCSSIVLKTKKGYFLGHNEEYTTRYPLLVAKVDLHTSTGKKRFVSISHPFQLFGSSAGMNRSLAFSGNSIGCKDQEHWLRDTWQDRLPKTVISRKLLELSTQEEAEQLFSRYHVTLPSHQYIISCDRARSFQIIPTRNTHQNPSKQLMVNEIAEPMHWHANHFTNFSEWQFSKEYQQNSIERHDYISKSIKPSEKNVQKLLVGMAQHSKFSHQTAASLFFTINNNGSCFHGYFYFADEFKIRLSMRKSD
ncbi:MAG: C45 family autoproteolytic acyltransferase/hydrolase [Desulfobulbaceae bacterium]